MSEGIGLLGAGGQADEAASYLDSETRVLFRALSPEYVNENNPEQINILSPQEYQKIMPVVAAIGAPAVRKEMVEKWPGDNYEIIRAQESYVDETVKVGEGSIIAPGVVITTNVEIGAHAIINISSSISHDCKLGDYVTVSPGAHIAGKVEIGDGVFIGIGAIVSNGIRIANGSVVGAGALVIKDILEENSVVVGSPAKLLRRNEGWLREI